MPDREELRKKLRNKINEKRIQTGRQPIHNPKTMTTEEDILNSAISMIKDCSLPYIKRLNTRQKYNVLEKKYELLRKKYMPIFRSILNEELTMENIGMLEMMLKIKDTVKDQDMNDFLAEKYKLNKNEASKKDLVNEKNVTKELKDYIDKKD